MNRVKRVSRSLLDRLGVLQTYNVSIYLEDKITAGMQGTKDRNEAAAEITSNYPYRDINIHVTRETANKYTDAELERLILHELLHPILYGWVHKTFDMHSHERQEAEVYAEEDVVSLITQWLMVERSEKY